MAKKFIELSPEKTKTFLGKLDKTIPDHGFNLNHVKIMSQSLSFTTGWHRYVCEDFSSVPFKSKSYISDNKKIYPVSFSSDPFEDNQFDRMNLNISEDTVVQYISFYYSLYVTQADILKPVIHVDEIAWQDDLPPMTWQSLEKDFRHYPKIKSEKQGLIVTMPCIFRQSIIIVTFFITPEGIIEIKDRQSLADNLPIRSFA